MVNSNKIAGLDSLRFFAFLSVFLFHSNGLFKFGYLGIDYFFVLSSFLITYLALNEINLTNKFSKINFFIRRALRIYPLFFLVLLFSFIILPHLLGFYNQKITLPENKFFYFFFLSNFDYSDHLFALKFLWSIAIEEQFYLLFLLLSFFFKRNFFLPLIGLCFVYLIYNFFAYVFHWNTYFNTLNYFIDFAVGMGLAKLFFYLSKIKLRLILFALLFLALICYGFHQIDYLMCFLKLPLALFFSGIILFAVKIFSFPLVNKNKVFLLTEYLGKYTFGLYVYSGFVISFGSRFIWIDSYFLRFLTQVLLLFFISLLSYHFIEKPFLQLKRRFRLQHP